MYVICPKCCQLLDNGFDLIVHAIISNYFALMAMKVKV